MQDRDGFSDETPVADAIEQDQDTAHEPVASDWQEQHQYFVGADNDRDEYHD